MLVCIAVPAVSAYAIMHCAGKRAQPCSAPEKKSQMTPPAPPAASSAPPAAQSTPKQDNTQSKSKEADAAKKAKEEEKKTEKEKETEKEKDDAPQDNRAKWANKVLQMKCKTISQEFTENVKKWSAPGMTNNAHMDNPIKNRYTDVLCLDATRVVLKGRGKDDYIHASWMTVPDKATKYICTQGPLSETQEDFWCLVFQEKTKFIIMLCNLMEGGAEKCTQYWPEKKGDSVKHGEYKVTNFDSKPDPVEGVKWTLIDVTFKGETFQVYHVSVTWWPDQLAPVDPAPMVALYKWVKKTNNDKEHPILVHCSAGVGRTATFVGIDYANQRIKENPNTSLQDVIKEMRAQRFQSIQSHVQYLYLHIVLLEYFVQEGVLSREGKVQDFIEEYQRHAERKLAKRKEEEKE